MTPLSVAIVLMPVPSKREGPAVSSKLYRAISSAGPDAFGGAEQQNARADDGRQVADTGSNGCTGTTEGAMHRHATLSPEKWRRV